jgi:type IV/VI secretion system ImpK/VasF family protein
MQERTQDAYLLLREFRQFYIEVVRLRQAIHGSQLTEAAPRVAPSPRFRHALAAAVEPGGLEKAGAGTALAISTEEELAPRVWQEVANYLDEKMFELKHAGNALFRDRFEELIYIMAAFADEMFLCMVEWPGSAYWSDHLMELRYFRSQISGLMIFSRIDDLLKRRDYGDDELCAIYLMLLSLGFKGSYARNPSAIDEYRGKLYDLLLLMNPAMRRESSYIFPEAYRHTVTEGAPVRLPEPRTWWLGVGAIVAAWLIVSTIGWFVLTRSTRADLKVVNNSLSGVMAAKTASTTSRRYEPMQFETTTAGFRLALDSVPPVDGSKPGSLLIAVHGQDGNIAGSDDDVRTSLLRGVVAAPGLNANLATYTRAVLDVRLLPKAPAGLTLQRGTLLFAVDLPVDQDQSYVQHDLFFPQEPGPSEVNIHSLVAYRPVGPGMGVQ